MQVVLKCLKCGSEEFANAQNKLFKDQDKVKCLHCGATYPFEEIKKVAIERALEQYARENKKELFAKGTPITDQKELEQIDRLKNNKA